MNLRWSEVCGVVSGLSLPCGLLVLYFAVDWPEVPMTFQQPQPFTTHRSMPGIKKK